MVSKQQFYMRPSIRKLSKAEKAKRWKQHLASQTSVSTSGKSQGFRYSRMSVTGACVKSYSQALLNPFKYSPSCFPYPPAIASQKFSVNSRVTVKVGSGGVGYVMFGPSAANDHTAITYTGSANSLVTSDNFAETGTGINSGALTKNPYDATDFTGGDVSCRLTAAGIRLISTTSALYRNGLVAVYRDPDNVDMTNFTIEEIFQSSHSSVHPHDTREYMVTYLPSRPIDFEYTTNDDYFGRGSYSPCMVIAIDASNANETQTFSAEVVMHYEMIGRKIYATTTSEVDIQNTTKVISNASDFGADTSSQIANGTGNSLYTSILKGVYLGTVAAVGNTILRQGGI